ncbi:unnamed protein product [Bubo scandiacus]
MGVPGLAPQAVPCPRRRCRPRWHKAPTVPGTGGCRPRALAGATRGPHRGSGTRVGVGDTGGVRGSPPLPARQPLCRRRGPRRRRWLRSEMSALSPRRASTSGSCPLLTEPGWGGGPGGSGRWSPLSGARLEEMVREATRLAAQLERCHLPPRPPRPPARPPQPPQPPPRDLRGEGQSRAGAAAHRGVAGDPPHAATTRPPAKPRGPPLPPTSPAPGRRGGGAGGPPGRWLGVQTRTPLQPPPPPRKTAVSSTPR